MNKTTIENKIQELVGEATMCWSEIEKAGTFQSDKAIAISDKIIKLFNDEFNKLPIPSQDRED